MATQWKEETSHKNIRFYWIKILKLFFFFLFRIIFWIHFNLCVPQLCVLTQTVKKHCPRCVSPFCYLSPPALYPSILPAHNLFHYVSPLSSRSNSLSPSLPPFFLSSFHFLSISPSLLILPLGVRMRGFWLAASRSVYTNHRKSLTDASPLAVAQPWAQHCG